MKFIVAALVLCFAVAPAWAQVEDEGGRHKAGDDGPGKKGGGEGDPGKKATDEPVPWSSSFDDATKGAESGDKYILLYVSPVGETADPACFKTLEAANAVRTNWIFLKRPFSKEDAELKRLKVTAASTLVGMDCYSNDFKRGTLSASTLGSILKGVPPAVKSLRQKIGGWWSTAFKVLGTDAEDQAIKPMVDIVVTGRHGYKEIVDSAAKIREMGEKYLKAAEDLMAKDEAGAVKRLKETADRFKGTSAAAAAEVRLAKYENGHAAVGSAVARVVRLSKLEAEASRPEADAASELLNTFVDEGLAKVTAAAKDSAALKKLMEEYKGTSVEQRAGEALKALG